MASSRKVGIEFVVDGTTNVERAFSTVSSSAATSAATVKEASVSSTEAVVAARVKQIESLRASSAAFTAAAASYVKGSDEQRAAADLAIGAQRKLQYALGETAIATGRTGGSAAVAERDLGKATRGALAGAGAVAGLGRSLAFASGGFLAFAGGANLLRSSIRATQDLAATQRQVQAQLKTSGKSWDQYGAQVDAVDLRLSHISGFTNQELLQSFGYLVRVTGNVSEALKLNATAADVARGRNISLSSASVALGKALGGSTTALKRLGIEIPKGASRMDALNFVTAKFAGQAQAGATESERFHAALVDAEETIGTALLPTFTRLTTELGDWITRMQQSGQLQRDINRVVTDSGHVFHFLEGVIRGVDKVTGSFVNTLKILAAFKLASLVTGWVGSLRILAAEWGLVRTAALGATAAEAAAGSTGIGALARGGAGAGGGIVAAGRFAGRGAAIEAAAPFAPFAAIVALGADTPVSGPKSVKVLGYTSDNQSIGKGSDGNYYAVSPRGLVPVNKAQASAWAASVRAVPGAPVITPQLQKLGGSILPSALRIPGFSSSRTAAGSQGTGPFGTARPQPQATGFNLTNLELIAQAQAALTVSTKDDVAAARQVIARIKRFIDRGNYTAKGYLAALQAEAAALGVVQSAEAAAASKRQAAAAKIKALASTFTTSIDLQIAEVRAAMTASTADDKRVAREEIAAARAAIASGKKNKQGVLAALQVILSAQQALKQVSATFTQSPQLQLALAKDQALGRDTTKDLLKMRGALLKFIRTHKHNIAALTDAYNQLAAINQQLGQTAQSALGMFKQASTRALTAGLGLTPSQRAALRARLSQLGPGGTVPGTGVGAAGYVINPDTGKPIVVHTHVNIDGKRVADNTTRHQQKRRRRNSSQRRGPNAGAAYGY